jgi:DNA modification methylase
LRKYAGEQDLIWGNHNSCEHQWNSYEASLLHENRNGLDGSSIGNTERREGKHGLKVGEAGYCSLCNDWRGSYGLEPTPELYITHTIEILNEIKRVLRKDGTVFWNIGDSYAGSGGAHANDKSPGISNSFNRDGVPHYAKEGMTDHYTPANFGLKPKDLCLIPFRVAIAAQEAGWWVRSVIIWNKPNPMPESVKDRPTEAHEYILLLTKSSKYYWDMEAVREPHLTEPGPLRDKRNEGYGKAYLSPIGAGLRTGYSENGRNLRSVWTFPTQGYPEAHFATFPEELPERCIKAGTPEYGCCDKCGTPYERIVERKTMVTKPSPKQSGYATHGSCNICGTVVSEPETKTLGWRQACKCAESKPVPSTILDPFAGSGTTLLVAAKLGRKAVGYEISESYCKLIVERNNQMALSEVTD